MLKSTLTRLRENRTVEGEGAAEAGFTLIELMVVLLIIAILLAIAIPTFLGVSSSANDRSAQSNLTNALTEVKALYQNTQSYTTGNLPAATLLASAPEFTWSQSTACGASAGTNCVSEYPVDVQSAGDGAGVILATLSKTNICWYTVDLEASPGSATFTDTVTAPATATKPFFGSASAAGGQTLNGSAITQAGVYYAKQTATGATTCNASNAMVSSGQWNWGTSYSNAPVA